MNENDVTDSKQHMDKDFLNESKPLTELSRKAEEEVNHLTKNNDSGSSKNNILHNHNGGKDKEVINKNANTTSILNAGNITTVAKSSNTNSTKTTTTETATTKQSISKNINENINSISNKGIRINETLAILDKSVGGIIKSNNENPTSAQLNNTSPIITADAKKKSFQSETKKANSTGNDIVAKVKTSSSTNQSISVSKETSAVVGDEGLTF